MINFSVAICTYNGETQLPRVLDRLLSQTQTESLTWEIIVIDNNSTDQTAKVVQAYQSQFSQLCPKIRYYFEPKQGIAFARRLAIKQSKSPLIGFLDDDNLPSPDWVYKAYLFGKMHPKAGAYGSQLDPLYEVAPPKNFNRIACFLAIVNRGESSFRYDLMQRWLFPPGAGLVIRKKAWLSCVPDSPFFRGVTGKSLQHKGEDIEALSYLRKARWEIWHNPQMQVDHYIPQSRLQKIYLVKLLRGIGLSRYPTRMLQLYNWQKPFLIIVYWLNDLRKLVVHCLKYYNVIKTDPIARSELEFFLSSLMSPFYHWLKS